MKAEVTSATGTTVRKGSELNAEKIDHLPRSTVIHLSGQQKMEYDKGLIEKQVHITFPHVGWVSGSHVAAFGTMAAGAPKSNVYSETPQMQPKLNFCVSCGVSLRSNVGAFCSNCGAAVRSNTASTPCGAPSAPPMYTESPQANSTSAPQVNASASAERKESGLEEKKIRCTQCDAEQPVPYTTLETEINCTNMQCGWPVSGIEIGPPFPPAANLLEWRTLMGCLPLAPPPLSRDEASYQWPLGAVACGFLLLLTCALLMTPSHSKAN